MSLKLRIHYDCYVKTLTFRKNDVLKDITYKMMEELGIKNVEL